MSWSETQNKVLASNLIPDWVTRRVIRWQLRDRLSEFNNKTREEKLSYKLEFFDSLKTMPIAIVTEKANEQHYEAPTEFFLTTLGKRLKYSCAYYDSPNTTLNEAEENMLQLYCERAQLQDGQEVLDLGCGWGSFSLFCCEKYPNSRVIAVSNSTTQRAYIEGQARERGIKNLQVITGDINTVEMKENQQFDRIVSVEMMEHTKNTEALFRKLASWLKPGRRGMLFTHIFVHKEYCYHFDQEESSWMTKYFFSGGTMPSEDMFLYFQRDLQIEAQWRVSGTHYSRTCEDWLSLTDRNRDRVLQLFLETYGSKQEAIKWFAMWRTFYLACSELFAYSNGDEWYIAHYLFSKP